MDQARKAVAGVAADAPAALRIVLVEHQAEWQRERVMAQIHEIVVELLNARLVADGRVRIVSGSRWVSVPPPAPLPMTMTS